MNIINITLSTVDICFKFRYYIRHMCYIHLSIAPHKWISQHSNLIKIHIYALQHNQHFHFIFPLCSTKQPKKKFMNNIEIIMMLCGSVFRFEYFMKAVFLLTIDEIKTTKKNSHKGNNTNMNINFDSHVWYN